MQWTHLDTARDIPPPCRAHTATLYDCKHFIYGSGLGLTYYDAVYILNTTMQRWPHPNIISGHQPASRQVHSTVYCKGKGVFGGGNELTALNDVWTLDVSSGAGLGGVRPMCWTEKKKRPGARGHHMANLIGNIMVVIGSSNGKECFTDVWCLNLGT